MRARLLDCDRNCVTAASPRRNRVPAPAPSALPDAVRLEPLQQIHRPRGLARLLFRARTLRPGIVAARASRIGTRCGRRKPPGAVANGCCRRLRTIAQSTGAVRARRMRRVRCCPRAGVGSCLRRARSQPRAGTSRPLPVLTPRALRPRVRRAPRPILLLDPAEECGASGEQIDSRSFVPRTRYFCGCRQRNFAAILGAGVHDGPTPSRTASTVHAARRVDLHSGRAGPCACPRWGGTSGP